MSNSIPKYLISREYIWENVNTSLYSNLDSLLKGKFKKDLLDLMKIQKSQCNLLENLLTTYKVESCIFDETEIQYFNDISTALAELIKREKELLIVYSSYRHFLKDKKELSTLAELKSLQNKQVSTLVYLRLQLKAEQRENRRNLDNKNLWIEDGFKCEQLVSELTSPTCMTFSGNGELYIAETVPSMNESDIKSRIICISKDGVKKEIISELQHPVTGIACNNNSIYAISGGFNGKIYQISKDGTSNILIDGLRSGGDHSTSGIVFGPDGKMYFGVGTVTNSSVVGKDNFSSGWLKANPDYRDIPGRDLISFGKNFKSPNFLDKPKGSASTGAFHSFGRKAAADEIVRGHPFANGVIYRAEPDGSGIELIADGLRSISGLSITSEGKLYLINNGMEFKGSRPIINDMDAFYEVFPGWYGWPDYGSGLPVTLSHFQYPGFKQHKFVLYYHPPLSSMPLIRFSPDLTALNCDFCKNDNFASKNEILFLLLDNQPATANQAAKPCSFKIVRVNPTTGQLRNVMIDKTPEERNNTPLRPIALCFSPDGSELCILDSGIEKSNSNSSGKSLKCGTVWKLMTVS